MRNVIFLKLFKVLKMSYKYNHDNCKYYGRPKCPQIDSDTMKRAIQPIPPYHGGGYTKMKPLPTNEEIDKLCNNCDTFTQR